MTETKIEKDTTECQEALQALNEQIHAILEEYKEKYILTNQFPDYDEYKQVFEKIKTNLNEKKSALFEKINKTDIQTDTINKKMRELNIKIRTEKRRNTALRATLGITENKNDSTYELINNYTEMYDIDYVRNWALVLGIGIIIAISTKMFRNRQVVANPIRL